MKAKSRARSILLTFWISVGLLLTAYFNACSQTVFKTSQNSLRAEMQGSALILINKDEPFTNSTLVELTLQSRQADEVYVTEDPTCASGGTWEPLVELKNWNLGKTNQQAAVYAKFRNVQESLETSCLSDSIVHDDVSPLVLLQEPVFATNVETPIFNFVASDSLSGLDRSTCAWPGQNPVICNFASSNGKLNEGRYLVPVVAYDLAGNVSAPVVQDLLVDRTKPVITLLSTPPALSNSSDAAVSFDVQDNLSGVKSKECSWGNNNSYAACTSPIAKNLAEGEHKIYIRASDHAGNLADEVSYSFVIDLTAPTVTITSQPPDFSNSASATFAFEGKDGNVAITRFECRLDNQAFSSCTSPLSYSGLSEGLHKFEVRGYDAVGNLSQPAVRNWFVDLTAPVITWIQTPPSLSNLSTVQYRYSISDAGSGVDKAQCSLDGAAYQDCSLTGIDLNALTNGDHIFRVRAYDKAGNIGQASHSFVIDKTAPTIQFTQVPPAFSNQASFQFGFSAADDRGIARVECRQDAGQFLPCDSVVAHMALNLAEGARQFSVRAVDTAGNASTIATHNWTVDLSPPVLSFFQMPPASAPLNSTISIGFSATDTLSGVKSVICQLNGSATSCASGVQKDFSNLPAGDYTYSVTALDNAGNTVTDNKTFVIRPAALKIQTAEVKVNPLVDILVVIDNSGSMANEQANMGSRFASFLDKIKELNWQIGIITTDVSSDAAKKDGRLVVLNGLSNQYILHSSMDPTQAQQIFSNTVQMGTGGSGLEYGIKASIRAIERAFDIKAINAPNTQLFREEASLAVVVVSDALDDSGTQPEDLINLVKNKWAGKKNFTFHSIVVPESAFTDPNAKSVNPNDPCANYRESVKFDGRIYHRLSDLTGGVKGTVCSEDYSSQLSAMGQVTADLVNSLTLECQPFDQNGDGQVDAADIEVRDANGALLSGYTLNGTKLTFSSALPVGLNELRYYCVE